MDDSSEDDLSDAPILLADKRRQAGGLLGEEGEAEETKKAAKLRKCCRTVFSCCWTCFQNKKVSR